MTYIYSAIRRDLWESNIKNPQNTLRTIPDIWSLASCAFKVLIILYIVSLVVYLVMMFFDFNPWLYVVSSIVQVVTIGIISLSKERLLYKSFKRQVELQSMNLKYEEFIEMVGETFIKYGVDKPEKISLLKTEAELRMTKHKNKTDGIISKITSSIMIPFFSFIIIEINNTASTINIDHVVQSIMLWIVSYFIYRIYKFISYYTDGYNKDDYLLTTLKELEYIR